MGCSPWGCKELGTTEQLTLLLSDSLCSLNSFQLYMVPSPLRETQSQTGARGRLGPHVSESSDRAESQWAEQGLKDSGAPRRGAFSGHQGGMEQR